MMIKLLNQANERTLAQNDKVLNLVLEKLSATSYISPELAQLIVRYKLALHYYTDAAIFLHRAKKKAHNSDARVSNFTYDRYDRAWSWKNYLKQEILQYINNNELKKINKQVDKENINYNNRVILCTP